MSNLILAIVTVAIVTAAISAFGRSSVGPQVTIADSMKVMERKAGEAARTELSSVSLAVSGGGTTLDWRLGNTGQEKLRAFEDWDLIVRYHGPTAAGLNVERLEYTASGTPAAGQWTVTDIYAGAGPGAEAFEPGIVNPGEQFDVEAALSPVIGAATSNSVAIAVSSGVYLAVGFTN